MYNKLKNGEIKIMKKLSPLQEVRLQYQPKLPESLKHGIASLIMKEGEKTKAVKDEDKIEKLFPNCYGTPIVEFQYDSNTHNETEEKNIGVILSGGQAPGGHNVISGLYDALKNANKNNKLYGFLGGPSGIIEGNYIEFDDKIIDKINWINGKLAAIESGHKEYLQLKEKGK